MDRQLSLDVDDRAPKKGAQRLSVTIPVELREAVERRVPGIRYSDVLSEALRGLVGCRHERLECVSCQRRVNAWTFVEDALGGFYADALYHLEELVGQGGTAEGAARVLKGVAERHGVPNTNIPLPRPSRKQRKAVAAAAG